MVLIKLKKEFTNMFSVKDKEELNRINLRVFRGLEDVIKTYTENLVCKKSNYTDDMPFWAVRSSKGEMVYATYPDEKAGRLEIRFCGEFDSYQLKGYNYMKIYLHGDTDKTDLKIIDDLVSKFKSFGKPQEGD